MTRNDGFAIENHRIFAEYYGFSFRVIDSLFCDFRGACLVLPAIFLAFEGCLGVLVAQAALRADMDNLHADILDPDHSRDFGR
jgi:hypothetical protein